MKVLISVKDAGEAAEVLSAGGVHMIDVKNPEEGTLGANHPWVIADVKSSLPKTIRIGASIGDLDYRPGGASLAAYGAASLGVDYITAPMYRLRSAGEVEAMTKMLLKALEDFDTGLIVAGYADYGRCGAPNPFEFLPAVGGADYFMLDTAIKDGKNILDFTTPEELSDFMDRAHDIGLRLIIAGSLRYPQLETIADVSPDVVGFRGLVCHNGRVRKELVEELLRWFDET